LRNVLHRRAGGGPAPPLPTVPEPSAPPQYAVVGGTGEWGMYGKEARNEDKISRSEKAVSGSWTAQDIAALKGLHRWKAQVGTELLLK
jgi:hypothetical protein